MSKWNAGATRKLLVGVALTLMLTGTLADQGWVRAWALMVATAGAGMYVAESLVSANKRWAHKVYEDGWSRGRAVGHEEGVREGMLLTQAARHAAEQPIDEPVNREGQRAWPTSAS